jgi:MFS family permease
VDLTLFKNLLFSINLGMGMLVFIALGGMFIFPFYLDLVLGYSVQQVGLLMMATPIIMGLVAPIAGNLSDRFGPRGISVFGLVIILIGCFSISTLHSQITPLGYIIRIAPFGLGFGIFQSPNNSAIMGAAPKEKLGIVSGLLSLSRTLGQTTGLPLMGALFSAQTIAFASLAPGTDATTAPPEAIIAGISSTYRIAGLIILLAILFAVFALWRDRRTGKMDNENRHFSQHSHDRTLSGQL